MELERNKSRDGAPARLSARLEADTDAARKDDDRFGAAGRAPGGPGPEGGSEAVAPAAEPAPTPPTGAAAAAAVPAPASATGTATLGLRPRLVDNDGAAAHLLAVQARDRGPGFALVVELDEPEALRPAAVAVREDADRFRRAARREQFLQLVFGRVV